MGNFDKETIKAIDDMIQERENRLKDIMAERQEIKNKIGRLTVELKLWEALHRDKNGEYNKKKQRLEELKQNFYNQEKEHENALAALETEKEILEDFK